MADQPTDLTINDLHPAKLRKRPRGMRNAVLLHQRIRTISEWLGTTRSGLLGDLREQIRQAALRYEEQTGDPFRVEYDDLGKALLTNPEPRPSINHPEAFAAWLDDVGRSDWVVERTDVEVKDPATVAEVLAALAENDLDSVHLLLDAVTVTRTRVPESDGALHSLFEEGIAAVQDISDPTDEEAAPDLQVAYLDGDADVAIVPGTTVKLSDRQLQVRVDKSVKAAMLDQVVEAVGPPQLASKEDGQ